MKHIWVRNGSLGLSQQFSVKKSHNWDILPQADIKKRILNSPAILVP